MMIGDVVMSTIFRISVNLYPNNYIDSSEPFFWCLMAYSGKDWYTEQAGWASTQDEAWNTAYRFYKNYKCNGSDDTTK